MANVGTGLAGRTLIGAGIGVSPTYKEIGSDSGLTNYGVVVSKGASPFIATAAGLNGQLLIAANDANPAFATLTSSDGSISFSPGPNSLSIQVAAGNDAVLNLRGNDTLLVPPTLGIIDLLGTGSITTSGAASTETISLTGLTNHAVLVGAGTATITNVGPTTTVGQVLQSAGNAADPAFSTATYPLTTTVSQILYSSATNVVSGLATANRGVLTTGATGVPVITQLATDGQLIIGSTAGAPAAALLTAGSGVSIVNASNSITISASGGGLTWTVITIDQSAVVANGYICNKAGLLILTLPASAAIGDIIHVTGINTAAGWKIAQNASQRIHLGSSSTTAGVGGSLASTNIRDTVKLVCVVSGANTEYNVISSMGNITVV